MTTVTALARKPSVRHVPAPEIVGELEEVDELRLISVYLPDAGVQIMYCGAGRKLQWEASWGPLTLEDAIECAREQAYERQVAPEHNLLYVPQGFDRGQSGYVWGDVDAGRECLDIETLAAYQDRGDDCLLAFYDPIGGELQKYRVKDGLLRWWHKQQPMTLEQARGSANDVREERGLTFDQLVFIEVASPLTATGGGQ